MNKLNKILLALAIPLSLAACNETKTDKPSAPVAQGVSEQDRLKSIFDEAKKLNSFGTGSMMANAQAYVFFDPQCPHCAKLWANTQGLTGANLNWIPVSILNPKSTTQGAFIISSPDGAKLMSLHEQLMSNNMGGIETKDVSEEGKQKIKQNTEAFIKYKFQSVPSMVYQNAKTKQYGLIEGAVPRDVVEDKLGLK